MKKTLIIFGILLILIQFDFPGLPHSWDRVFYIVTGLVLLFIAFFNRRVTLPGTSTADTESTVGNQEETP
ncbi:hypothetical protein L0Y69_00315 [bacterium]|nr:hypothetical protein [bacterium]